MPLLTFGILDFSLGAVAQGGGFLASIQVVDSRRVQKWQIPCSLRVVKRGIICDMLINISIMTNIAWLFIRVIEALMRLLRYGTGIRISSILFTKEMVIIIWLR